MSNNYNYDELGFKCGIEIHQQLDTDTKLFCQCPVEMEDEAADRHVERYLTAVAGETGAKDKAAEVEEETKTKYIYNYYNRNNCLVELDEEPPHELDREALDVGLTFARMVDAEVPDEIQVMRKIVVDGSNTSGFQRTSMIGLGGELETESGTVNIEDIELEEESAVIHERLEGEAIFDLNRLGIPLVEVGTDASIKNPEHAREVAEKIGMLLRSTNKARRGLGTIRQDVNVSIEGGARVEIKGFQDVRNIDELIRLEVERQKKLIDLGEEFDSNEVEIRDVTEIFEDTENEIVSTILEDNGSVYCLKIPKMDGRMKENISGNRYLAKELVDYAKKRGVKGLIHTDEDIENYGLVEEFQKLEEKMDRTDSDVIAVIAGKNKQPENAAKAVKERAEMFYKGIVPEETRNAEQDFTTSYSRPLPGSARMYPETDIPAIELTEEKIERIEEQIPETLEERQQKYAEEIGEELATQIVSSEYLVMFEKYKEKVDPKLAANIFTNIVSQLESDGLDVESLEEEQFERLFDALEEDEISKGDIEDVLEFIIKNPSAENPIEEVMESKAGEEEIREVVKEVIEDNKEMIESQGMRAQGALMGEVMQQVDADGGTVSRILQEEIQEVV